jgi:hypothetical protein
MERRKFFGVLGSAAAWIAAAFDWYTKPYRTALRCLLSPVTRVSAISYIMTNHSKVRSFIGILLLATLFCIISTFPSKANDSSAELTTGGLVFVKNPDVEMLSEDLFISTEEIRVLYRFANRSNKDVTVYVAFPLPDLEMDLEDDVFVIPVDDPINFLGFVTTVNGVQVNPNVEQRIVASDQDQTAALTSLGIPLSPYRSHDALDKLSANEKARLKRLGLVNEDGQPLWTLKTKFYWQQRFPAGRETVIEHHYKPSVGGTVPVGSSQISQWLKDENHRKYCVDADFIRALAKDRRNNFGEERVDYILTTGANWSGPIKQFRLVVDKGDPNNLVSFCGRNVKQVGPTQFEMKISDFSPKEDIAVLFLRKEPPYDSGQETAEPNRSEGAASLANTSCDGLWYQRNMIFKAAGYCFKTQRAIREFGNAGCQYDDLTSVPLSETQRQAIDDITRIEAAKRCPL